jgi:hypothetical protein
MLNVTQRYAKSLWTRGLVNNSTRTAALGAIDPLAHGTQLVTIDESVDPTTNRLVVPLSGRELQLIPFGTNSDNDTFNFQVNLWSKTDDGTLHIPFYMGGFLATLSGNLEGKEDTAVLDGEYLADTITEIATATWDDATAPLGVRVRSHGSDHVALVQLDTKGFDYASIDFDIATGATGCNMLWRCI